MAPTNIHLAANTKLERPIHLRVCWGGAVKSTEYNPLKHSEEFEVYQEGVSQGAGGAGGVTFTLESQEACRRCPTTAAAKSASAPAASPATRGCVAAAPPGPPL